MSVRILIADDEPNQLELLNFNLEQAGFEVVRASDGQQAIDMIEEQRPDLIILDWMMPQLSGIDVCRKLRANRQTKSLPVIILSARGEESDRTLGLDIGADDYISKPFSPRELVARVNALLRRSRPALNDEKLEFEDLSLNLTTMQITRAGQLVELGPKECQLLSILMERPGRVFSRAQLLDLVWGHGVYVEERTVDVHMSRLRKAINVPDADGQQSTDLIRTIRGSGYALRAPPKA
ncbi:phosphate regulon transcriptional regulator PhoB [Alphaproteobacteria bacterium]|nr:phosphate regulon transcriptional regulator PhoB [Alphaproteobacteria bacterium]